MGVRHLFGFVLLLSWPYIVLSNSDKKNDEMGYDFSYNVFIPQSGNYHGHRQRKDTSGRTSGTYYIMGPDGVWHETTFSDFGKEGFKSLNKKRSMSSIPEIAKYGENGLAVFFRMGKKSRDTEKSKPLLSSPYTIPVGSDTEDFPKIESSAKDSTSTISASSSVNYKPNKGEKQPTSSTQIENITSVKPTAAKSFPSQKLKDIGKESGLNNFTGISLKQTKTGKDIGIVSRNTQIASNLKPTETKTASTLEPIKTETTSTLKPTKIETITTLKPTKSETVSSVKPNKTQHFSSLKPIKSETASSLKLTGTGSAINLKTTKTERDRSFNANKADSNRNVRLIKTESDSLKTSKTESANSPPKTGTRIDAILKPTKIESASTLKLTKTESAITLKPTKIESASRIKPNVTSVFKPTVSQSKSSLKPTSSQITTRFNSSKSKSATFNVPSSLERVTDPESEEGDDSSQFRLTTPVSRENYDVKDTESFETPSSSESSGSFENSDSHEYTTSNFPGFNHFQNIVTPFLKPTLVPSTPTPLNDAFKKTRFAVDFAPFSGKFGNEAVGEEIHRFRTQKIDGTRILKEALSDEDEEDEDDDKDEERERKRKKGEEIDKASLPKISLKKPFSEVDVKDKIGVPIRFTKLPNTTEKQEVTTTLLTNKYRNNKEHRGRKEMKKEEESEEEIDDEDEIRDVSTPKPPKGRSLYNNPRLVSRRKNNLDRKKGKEATTTSVTPRATSYAISGFTHIPISTTPETPQSTEDSSDELNLKLSAKTVQANPVVQIPAFQQSSKPKGNFQRLQSTSSKSPLKNQGELKKPEEVINKISFIDLSGPLSPSTLSGGDGPNQFLKSPNFRPRRVVLPRDHKLVDILRKMAKEKPNVVSTKPFFVPLSPFNSALTSNIRNQVHLSGNPVDLLTIASNTGASYKTAPSVNHLPHSNHSSSKIINPLNSLKKTSIISLGQPSILNQKNVNQFIDKSHNDKTDKIRRRFPKNQISLNTTPGPEKKVSVAAEAPTSGLRIVKAKLNAVRLLEPMPLYQYINLIKRPTSPKATFLIDGFPLNQERDNNFSETSIRPSKVAREQILRAMTPRIHKSEPFRLLRYAPRARNQNIDTQTSKETKILMIKRRTHNSKVHKNEEDEQTKPEDLSENSLNTKINGFSSQEKTADETSKQLDTAPEETEGETKLFLALPPS